MATSNLLYKEDYEIRSWDGSIVKKRGYDNGPTIQGRPISYQYDAQRDWYRFNIDQKALVSLGPTLYLEKLRNALEHYVSRGQVDRHIADQMYGQAKRDLLVMEKEMANVKNKGKWYNENYGLKYDDNITWNATATTNSNTIRFDIGQATYATEPAKPKTAIEQLKQDVEAVAKIGRKILAEV